MSSHSSVDTNRVMNLGGTGYASSDSQHSSSQHSQHYCPLSNSPDASQRSVHSSVSSNVTTSSYGGTMPHGPMKQLGMETVKQALFDDDMHIPIKQRLSAAKEHCLSLKELSKGIGSVKEVTQFLTSSDNTLDVVLEGGFAYFPPLSSTIPPASTSAKTSRTIKHAHKTSAVGRQATKNRASAKKRRFCFVVTHEDFPEVTVVGVYTKKAAANAAADAHIRMAVADASVRFTADYSPFWSLTVPSLDGEGDQTHTMRITKTKIR